jgi:AraC family transcriptional activator of pobA
MMTQTAFTLVHPQTKALAFQLYAFEDALAFTKLRNHQYYSMLLVTEGQGSLQAGVSTFEFTAGCLLCLSLYEPFRIEATTFKGVLIHFHPNFFCIYKHEEEVACNGVLFNNIYQSPVIKLTQADVASFVTMIKNLQTEMQNTSVAQYEMLTAYLKIFLISAVRIKLAEQKLSLPVDKEPFILQTLKDAIEEHYRVKRSPGQYADLLSITPKALNRISKKHLNKTLSGLISERIVIEAKRELYLTGKPVKQIAYELGFEDEFYFSRFFKINATVSPQLYRETVGYAKGDSV